MKSIHPKYSSNCILVNIDLLDFNDKVSVLRSGAKDHYKPGSTGGGWQSRVYTLDCRKHVE